MKFTQLLFVTFPLTRAVEWGVATSAYQVEGFTTTDGRTPSIWDDFVQRRPSPIADGTTGDNAAQLYNQSILQKDLDWMASCHIQNYRFSISWSRLFPTWESLFQNNPNPKAVAYYQNLLDGLNKRDIRPWVTLFHWDLPVYLQNEPKGWVNETFMVGAFQTYAENVFALYNSSVERWFTLNEPYTVCSMGYEQGAHAPGIRNTDEALRAAHTMLLSHIAVYEKFHALNLPGKIGIALNCDYYEGTDSTSQARAEHQMVSMLGWFMDPLVFNTYPSELNIGKGFSVDSQTLYMDFVALNTYSATQISNYGSNWSPYPNSVQATSSWLHAYPPGIGKLIDWMYTRYESGFSNNTEFMISENGFSTSPTDIHEKDTRGKVLKESKEVLDSLASKYTQENKKWNVTTYTIWSYLDNFEWASGETERFGLLSWNSGERWERCEKDSVDVLFPNRTSRIYESCTF